MPKSFDVSHFEKPAHKILREEFQALTAVNIASLDSFDPNASTALVDIELEPSMYEAEDAEPDFAQMLRNIMLNDIGLAFSTRKQDSEQGQLDDSIRIEAIVYTDGSYEQLRHITRADGVVIPVYSRTAPDYDDNPEMKNIYLLSYERAEALYQSMEARIADHATNVQLAEALDMAVEDVESKHMALQAKQQMLSDITVIRDLATHRPDFDLTDLKELRHMLAKRMLPSSKWLAKLSGRRTGELMELYCEEFNRQVKLQHGDDGFRHDLTTTERNERRELLEIQLHKRRRVTVLGGVAITGYVTSMGGATGYFAAQQTLPSNTVSAVCLALGIHSGFKYGKARFSHMLRRSQMLSSFAHLPTSATPDNEIHEEWVLAQHQLQATRP